MKQNKRTRKDGEKSDSAGRVKRVQTPHGHYLLAKAREFGEKKVFKRVNSASYGDAHKTTECCAFQEEDDLLTLPREVADAFEAYVSWDVSPIVYVDVGSGGGEERLTKALEAGELGCVIRAVSLNPVFGPDDVARRKKMRALRKLDPRLIHSEDGLGTFNREVRYLAVRERRVRPLVSDEPPEEFVPPQQVPVHPLRLEARAEGRARVLIAQAANNGPPEIHCSDGRELTVAAWLSEDVFSSVARLYASGVMSQGRSDALLRFLELPVRYIYNFTHSYYYIEEWEKSYFQPADTLFSQTHLFRGASGCFPMAGDRQIKPEFRWVRMANGRIKMMPCMPGGTPYYHRDTTAIYDKRFETVRRGALTPIQQCVDADWACPPEQAVCDVRLTMRLAYNNDEHPNWYVPLAYRHLRPDVWRPYVVGNNDAILAAVPPTRECVRASIDGMVSDKNMMKFEKDAMASCDADSHPDVTVTLYWSSVQGMTVDLVLDGEDGEEDMEDVLMVLYEGHVVPAGMVEDDDDNMPTAQQLQEILLETEGVGQEVAVNGSLLENAANCMVLKTDLLMGMEACMDTMQLHASSLIARFHVSMSEALEALNSAHARRARIIDQMTGENAKAYIRLRQLRANYRFNTGEGRTLRFAANLRNADMGFGTRMFTPVAKVVEAYGRYRTSGDPRSARV